MRETGKAVEPFGDQHIAALFHHGGNGELGCAGEGRREGLLIGRFGPVIEFAAHTLTDRLGDGLDVGTRQEHRRQRRNPPQLRQIRLHRRPPAGIHDLDRDRPSVMPHPAMHLTDGGGSGAAIVELAEQAPPATAQTRRHRRVDGRRQHDRRRVLQPRQRDLIGIGYIFRQRELINGQQLAEFGGAPLELAEHLEDVLGGPQLDLAIHLRGGTAECAPARAGRAPPRVRHRQGRQPGVARRPAHGRGAVGARREQAGSTRRLASCPALAPSSGHDSPHTAPPRSIHVQSGTLRLDCLGRMTKVRVQDGIPDGGRRCCR